MSRSSTAGDKIRPLRVAPSSRGKRQPERLEARCRLRDVVTRSPPMITETVGLDPRPPVLERHVTLPPLDIPTIDPVGGPLGCMIAGLHLRALPPVQ